LGQEYQVDGVIYVYLKFCTAYGIPKKLFGDHFRRLGIPVFEVLSDYSHSDSGQLRTRFEAFFEMLQEAKALP
ncbi:MAG TPA: 2-hydroxyacyl-CoA dehydratase family protein, partial [Phototrophicaceae bacterium]|nr:2-hydroxyacyl-CoA dehydratase family protein [Phototrophicaceae bacterium]